MAASIPGDRPVPESQFDLQTYWGRVRQMASITDPRTLLVGNSELESAKALIKAFKSGQVGEMTDEIWHAKKLIDSTLHRDTGAVIPLPFRMSCFALSSTIVTAGMLTPGMGTVGTVAWQTMNQSLNVAINYANANASSGLPLPKLVQSYLIAVGTSCGIALSLNSAVPRLKFLSPTAKAVASRLVPFTAVVSASVANIFLTRGEELRNGIDVFPIQRPTELEAIEGTVAENGSLGRSKKAALLAVSETAMSRVISATPIMVVPPLVMMRLQNTNLLRQSPRMVHIVNIGLIAIITYTVVPLALAVFPQTRIVDATTLEPEFHQSSHGGKVFFNRGI